MSKCLENTFSYIINHADEQTRLLEGLVRVMGYEFPLMTAKKPSLNEMRYVEKFIPIKELAAMDAGIFESYS